MKSPCAAGFWTFFPPISPWPVRLEFFGDELESLRYFDPLTQISRAEIVSVALPPAGELGILKQSAGRIPRTPDSENGIRGTRPSEIIELVTLLDHLPRHAIFLPCEPEQLAACADEYESQVPRRRSIFYFVAGFSDRIEPPRLRIGSTGRRHGGWRRQSAIRNPAIRNLIHLMPSVRWRNARPNRRLPRRNAVNFSSSFTAGSGKSTTSTSFATTMASANALRKSGKSSV